VCDFPQHTQYLLLSVFQAQLYSDQARKFFDLPVEEKVKFARPAAGGENGGWASIGREQ